MIQAPAKELQQDAVALAAEVRSAGIPYALIGGLAVLLRGYRRATFDMDFLIAAEHRKAFVALLEARQFTALREAEYFGNYLSPANRRVDALYARSPLGLGMLERATSCELQQGELKVVSTEDLIGLKLQALGNDPERFRDWGDVRELLRLSADSLDMKQVREYFAIFGFDERLEQILAGSQSRRD